MPELPEVETIRRTLAAVLRDRVIVDVEIRNESSIKFPSPGEFQEAARGKRIKTIERRGKYLIFALDNHSLLVTHLRMTGRLLYWKRLPPIDKYYRLIFRFDDNSFLAFHDVRKFGAVWCLPSAGLKDFKALAALGPEPLSGEFSADYLRGVLKNSRSSVKAILLNQQVIAGVGNIYADEILHRACILPQRAASSLGEAEINSLRRAIREVLEEAILWRGTTMSDYRDANGFTGQFQHRLRVYGRQGEKCPRCGEVICKNRTAGRGTHYCPVCQH